MMEFIMRALGMSGQAGEHPLASMPFLLVFFLRGSSIFWLLALRIRERIGMVIARVKTGAIGKAGWDSFVC